MGKRREITWYLSSDPDQSYPTPSDRAARADIQLIFTRQGIEVSGWYDTFVGLGDVVHLPWAQIDAWRELVMGRDPIPDDAGVREATDGTD